MLSSKTQKRVLLPKERNFLRLFTSPPRWKIYLTLAGMRQIFYTWATFTPFVWWSVDAASEHRPGWHTAGQLSLAARTLFMCGRPAATYLDGRTIGTPNWHLCVCRWPADRGRRISRAFTRRKQTQRLNTRGKNFTGSIPQVLLGVFSYPIPAAIYSEKKMLLMEAPAR